MLITQVERGVFNDFKKYIMKTDWNIMFILYFLLYHVYIECMAEVNINTHLAEKITKSNGITQSTCLSLPSSGGEF